MYAVTTVTITLPDSLTAFVEAEVAAKGLPDISAYVTNLLREAQVRTEAGRIEALLLEGLASPALSMDAKYRKGLQTRAERLFGRLQDRVRP